MRPSLVELALGAGVALAVAVSLWAGPNLASAAPAAAAAIVLAAALVAPGILRRVRPRPASVRITDFDSLVGLRNAFQKGTLGRQEILATLTGLEANLLGARREVVSLEQEERLRRVPSGEFRKWVDGRLDELERVS